MLENDLGSQADPQDGGAAVEGVAEGFVETGGPERLHGALGGTDAREDNAFGRSDSLGIRGDDGFGTDGHDYWAFADPKDGPFARFEFDPKALGALPRSVGIVWTDGNVDAITIFEAFGPDGRSLGTMEFFALDDGHGQGQTAEDRFMGAIYKGGISAIEVRADLGRIELDHVQYGNLVPAPGALGLLSLAGLFRRRARRAR